MNQPSRALVPIGATSILTRGVEAPARSSLSYANAHRPWELFEAVFHGLFEKVAATVTGKRRKFRFKKSS